MSHSHHHTTNCSHDHQPAIQPIPVTLLSGFLGSGKTTLVKHILASPTSPRIALIVNDLAPLNIDSALIAKSGLNLTQRTPELVQMQNGCICCTLRQDLIQELGRLAAMTPRPFDYILIESTGMSEPMQVAESFAISPELLSKVRLDTCVSLVDVPNFSRDLFEGENAKDRFPQEECDETRPQHVSALLIDQVEFANVILLNKVDLVKDPSQIASVRAMIQKLNPHAKIYETRHSQIEVKHIINTNLFDMDRAETSTGWLESLREEQEGKDLQSELAEYGVSSFIYRRRKPLHPEKLRQLCFGPKGYFVESHLNHIARSKGFLWIAGSPRFSDVCYEWEQSGSHFVIRANGHFFASMDEQQWSEEVPDDLKDQIKQDWEGEYGDRRVELVFIGYKDMNEQKIVQLLDECLVSDEQFAKGPEDWSTTFPDESMPQEFDTPEDDEIDMEDEDEGEYIVEESSDDDIDEEHAQKNKRRRTEQPGESTEENQDDLLMRDE
eukprot:CAMPEP_0117437110 /NCGR_PEP_ID=MMETSP0759-20121206/1353_1 /TAXON_ID=63605 /ORGANISM="Percolomonas cosmopolitus, Strain WS" /LENGTH=495 /DNA_ID=CAMNT_0005228729 /DNA_START=1355 /DNA_END=2842 /DNA_ORIENTATION=+